MAQPNLWRSTLDWKASLAAKMRKAGLNAEADTLDNCHTEQKALVCGYCGKSTPIWNRCDRLWCPICQIRLARERAQSVAWWAHQIRQPKHVVLTARNLRHLTPEGVQDFKDWWKRLRRSSLAAGWRGGFWSLELTNEGNGWHLHLHALIDADFIPAQLLESAWRRITDGAGYICRVYDARGTDYLREVAKYAVKGSQAAGWTPQMLREYITTFARCRTFGVFGSLYGERTKWKAWFESVQAEDENCECGANCWKVMTPEESEMFQPSRERAPPTPLVFDPQLAFLPY